MQTERVTFLTTPDHKAALDSFAAGQGRSVGHILREATVRYMAQAQDEEAELAALVEQVNEAMPKMQASIEHMIASMERTHVEVDQFLRDVGVRA